MSVLILPPNNFIPLAAIFPYYSIELLVKLNTPLPESFRLQQKGIAGVSELAIV
jgi:hypothetical protein